MRLIKVIIFSAVLTTIFSCKKHYDFNVKYDVSVTGAGSIPGAQILIEYTIKDNLLKKDTIGIISSDWTYSFKGASDDNAFIRVTNISGLPSVKASITIGGYYDSRECTTTGCVVEVKKQL